MVDQKGEDNYTREEYGSVRNLNYLQSQSPAEKYTGS